MDEPKTNPLLVRLLDAVKEYDELLTRTDLPAGVRATIERCRARTAEVASSFFDVDGQA